MVQFTYLLAVAGFCVVCGVCLGDKPQGALARMAWYMVWHDIWYGMKERQSPHLAPPICMISLPPGARELACKD